MLSDGPSASWHPAMMPNSALDLAPDHTPQHAQESTPAHGELDVGGTNEQHAGSDGWLADHETGGASLGQEHSDFGTEFATQDHTNAAAPPYEPVDAEDHGNAADETDAMAQGEVAGESTEQPSSATSKHGSSMSFARTVSHDPILSDEDDTEWNLTRTGTDPLKFIPPNERTNSFPEVPPVRRDETAHPELPLPSNQAEDIMHEVDQEDQREEAEDFFARAAHEAQENGYLDDADANGPKSHHQYAGGDLHGTAEEAAEARYAEGVPLIPHPNNTDPPEPFSQSHDPFAEDVEGGDIDFFSQVRGAESFDPSVDPVPTLERKSTSQVMQGGQLAPGGPSFAPLSDTIEEHVDFGGEDVDEDVFAKALAAERMNENQARKAEDTEDLDAKWKEMFADDDGDDLLLDDNDADEEVDPTTFFGSDDEGFLDELDQDQGASLHVAPGPAPAVPQQSQASPARYLPPGQTTRSAAQPASNPYFPTASAATSLQTPTPPPYQTPAMLPPASATYGYGAPSLPKPELNKAQSFVNASKGGYSSPYDLPMEVVKPKKRASMANLQRPASGSGAPPPAAVLPPRSTSFAQPPAQAPPPSRSGSASSITPPSSSHSGQVPLGEQKPAAKARHESFFEELPASSKVRPASRNSNKGVPSPPQTAQYGPPLSGQPLTPPQIAHPPVQVLPNQMAPPAPPTSEAQVSIADPTKLVAPARVNPYAALPGLGPVPNPTTSNRYSPTPPGVPQNGGVPVASNRYSPAPPIARPHSAGYNPSILPHQPRTSSPLAHFDSADRPRIHGPEGVSAERRVSASLYEPRLQRVPSLPQVEEEGSVAQAHISPRYAPPRSSGSSDGRPTHLPQRPRQTSPPPSTGSQTLLSPPKRSTSSYSPMTSQQEFAPPPRSQTRSPGAAHGNRGSSQAEPIPRPASVHSPTSPRSVSYMPTAPTQISSIIPPSTTNHSSARPRGFSQNLNVIPPTDGREQDPLQRWRGAPLISWGVGGTIVTMFPKDVPRYGMNQATPMVVRSPGEVKINSVKDIQPLEERLSKFPGPLKGKSKKKETINWLTTGIEGLEQGLPQNLSFQPHVSHDSKRAVERVLLWKILRLFVEHDGTLEGNETVDSAVRELLSLGPSSSSVLSSGFVTGSGLPGLRESPMSHVKSEAVDSTALEQIRLHLAAGDREKAVWEAADKRLWGHAMLIANTTSPELYKQVAQEFVKKEVNFPGHNNESLAALYEVLSGNHEESVDELVPVHARAGLQLVTKDSSSGVSNDAMAGLDKWRETLGLILSNRSKDDTRAINSLGSLLSGYGRAEAAHICFLFARQSSVFGGLDDPNSNFVLVGSDHRRQAEQFAKEIEPLLLSEVYEYGLSLAGSSAVPVSSPHLAGYKYQHALALAEYGFRDKALQYCEVINNAINAQTKRSPYHHIPLEAAVDDLLKRLKQAPRDDTGSWISKPSINKVSDSVWNRFNKFVSGEDNENPVQGSPNEGVESGPFARIAGGTPTISRSPSSNNLESWGTLPGYPAGNPTIPPMSNGHGPYGGPIPATRAASRYAAGAALPTAPASPYEPSSAYGPQGGAPSNPYEPISTYAPRSSVDRTSSELNRGSFEQARQSNEFQSNPYAPTFGSSPESGLQSYAGAGLGLSQESQAPAPRVAQAPSPPTAQPSPSFVPVSGYEPVGHPGAPSSGSAYQPAAYQPQAPLPQHESLSAEKHSPVESGYQPPSYGYEPPSVSAYQTPETQDGEKPNEATNGSSYEPPSYQPYSYEPPSYEANTQLSSDNADSDDEKPKPKKKGIMYDDDDDDLPVPKTRGEKSKEEKDRENAEMFRRVAEEEEKRAAEQAKNAPKKGWGFGGWFGGGKKPATPEPDTSAAAGNKPIRAKLGEANSFHYDPDLKRWINKNVSAEDQAAPKATPPPPRAGASTPRSMSGTPPPPMAGPSDAGRASAPPMNMGPPRPTTSGSSDGGARLAPPPAMGGPPSMMRSVSSVSNLSTGSAPPTRPSTGLSNSSSIDDLLAVGPKRPGMKKPRKSGRYVDVMAAKP